MSNQIVNKNFIFQETGINVYGTTENPLFIASQLAEFLEYADKKQAVRDNVLAKYKTTVGDYNKKGGVENHPLNLHPATILVNEMGVYDLIFKSKMALAQQFRDWVFTTVLPSIRKTGQYKQNPTINQITEPVRDKLTHNQFVIVNEKDLHQKVVDFIDKFYPDTYLIATLGENQDTREKRIESKKLGYRKGAPDIIIQQPNKHYHSLAIEFKTPLGNGVLSDEQLETQRKLNKIGTKTITIDNYDTAILEIVDYMANRIFKCEKCEERHVHLRYHTQQSLDNHIKHIHNRKH